MKKTEEIKIRVTKEQKQRVRELAEKAGLSISALILKKCGLSSVGTKQNCGNKPVGTTVKTEEIVGTKPVIKYTSAQYSSFTAAKENGKIPKHMKIEEFIECQRSLA